MPRICLACNAEDNGDDDVFLHNAGCAYLTAIRRTTLMLQEYDFDMDTQDFADAYGRCFLCDAVVQTGVSEDCDLWWLCSTCPAGVPWDEENPCWPTPPSCNDDDDDLLLIPSDQTTYGIMERVSCTVMTPSSMTVDALAESAPGDVKFYPAYISCSEGECFDCGQRIYHDYGCRSAPATDARMKFNLDPKHTFLDSMTRADINRLIESLLSSEEGMANDPTCV